MKKFAILATLMLLIVSGTVAVFAAAKGKNANPPWIGLQMHFSSNSNGIVENRVVSFLALDSAGNVIVRDSTAITGQDSILYIDPETREIVRCVGDSFLCGLPAGTKAEYWVSPRDLKVGASIDNATVVGQRKVSIMGVQVDAAVVESTDVTTDGRVLQRTGIYEKNTGLLLAASFVNMGPEPDEVNVSIGIQLTHTNQAFAEP